MEIPILYEDNHLLIIDKPANILVQGDQTGDLTVVDQLKNWIKIRDHKPGNVWLAAAHRLDRPVSGALICVKTSKAAQRLARSFQQHTVQRRYLAVVHGRPNKNQGTLSDYLIKDRRKNQVSVVSSKTKGAQYAELSYRTIATVNDLTLLEVELKTGRSHQIRVQLAHAGWPIIGDQRYGRREKDQQIALHSYFISISHPTQDKNVTVTCPTPTQWPWNLFESTQESF